MAAVALTDADAAALPDGWSFCVEVTLPLLLCLPPITPPTLLPAPLPGSAASALLLLGLLLPQLLPQLLPALSISPSSAFPLLCSPLCSAPDYEMFSSFAAVKSCVKRLPVPTYIAGMCGCQPCLLFFSALCILLMCVLVH